MIGLDTNVLARYYIEDKQDGQAMSQRQAARALIESGRDLMLCKTVILELEWVMRGYYGFSSDDTVAVLRHLLSLTHITVEDRTGVENALSCCESGLDFADALHHASYRNCESMMSFDDRRFARRAAKLGLVPAVRVPVA
jgi:predicted nucleic-acid-binding protein